MVGAYLAIPEFIFTKFTGLKRICFLEASHVWAGITEQQFKPALTVMAGLQAAHLLNQLPANTPRVAVGNTSGLQKPLRGIDGV